MLRLDLSRAAVLLGPLLVLGFAAGIVRALAQRPGLEPTRRRALSIGWVLTLLVGTPVWLFLAATLRL